MRWPTRSPSLSRCARDIERLTRAVDTIVRAAREEAQVIAIIVFGSYAREDFSRK
jgi:hypothetical protein